MLERLADQPDECQESSSLPPRSLKFLQTGGQGTSWAVPAPLCATTNSQSCPHYSNQEPQSLAHSHQYVIVK